MNIKESTIKAAKEEGIIVCCATNKYDNWYDKFSYFPKMDYIVVIQNYNSKIILAPKKEITLEWIMSKFDKDSSYINLSKYLNKFFTCGFNIYATSYGIGICSMFNRQQDIEKVENFLNDLGIEYRNELSDGGYVYRFVISKHKKNIDIMSNLK